MVLALLLSFAGPAVALKADDPPIRVELNHEQFTRGDRARVYVETVQDGHLVVLHADPDGRVRVLFPLDPSDDDFVRGGRRFELRGRSDRDAFLVDDGDGAGTVVAVFSSDPLRYDAFVRNDHWDYRAFGGGTTDLRDDPLAGLLDIARRMAGETHFEYDAATYIAGNEIASNYGSGSYGSSYDGYGHPYRFGVGLSFGYPGYYGWGYDPFCYDPFWGWSCGSRYGFGYSSYYYGRPYYYRPYAYSRYAGAWPRGFGRSLRGGSRFVIPRDRVSVRGIAPRRRVGLANPAAAPRGSRVVQPRGVQPRGRGPAVATEGRRGPRESVRAPRGGSSRGSSVAPRGGSSRGPAVAPRGGSSRGPSVSRGGSSRGPSVSRPSNGSRGRSQPSGGGGTRSGGSRSSGGGGRRH